MELHMRTKTEFLELSESEMVRDLQAQIDTLIEALAAEKQISEQEMLQMQQNFKHKIIEVREREAVREFECGKLDKELQLLQLEYQQYRLRNDQHQGSMSKEVERLRKFINDRQLEMSQQRVKVGSQLKKMKELIKDKDQEVREAKQDKYSRYLKNSTNTK